MHVLETPNSFCLEFWAIIVVPDKYLYFKPKSSLYIRILTIEEW
jgi:hypothetical protein